MIIQIVYLIVILFLINFIMMFGYNFIGWRIYLNLRILQIQYNNLYNFMMLNLELINHLQQYQFVT